MVVDIKERGLRDGGGYHMRCIPTLNYEMAVHLSPCACVCACDVRACDVRACVRVCVCACDRTAQASNQQHRSDQRESRPRTGMVCRWGYRLTVPSNQSNLDGSTVFTCICVAYVWHVLTWVCRDAEQRDQMPIRARVEKRECGRLVRVPCKPSMLTFRVALVRAVHCNPIGVSWRLHSVPR